MPTKTFLNLPIEKQDFLIQSAKQEFAKHPLMEVSINKIIQDAKIPRGSFYQYFEDKEDLFFYILKQEKEMLTADTKQMEELRGNLDLVDIPIRIYDFLYQYIVTSSKEEYYKNLLISFYKLGLPIEDQQKFFEEWLDENWYKKLSISKQTSMDLIDMILRTLEKMLIESIEQKERKDHIRKRLKNLLDILWYGLYKKEEEYEKSI